MQFIQLNDLTLKIKENILEDILEFSYTGNTSGSTELDYIEQGAIDEIKSYTNQYYDMESLFTTTGDTRDRFLVKLTIDIMLYELSCKLTPDNIPMIRQQRYDQVKNDLKDISSRKLVPNWKLFKRDQTVEDTSEMLWYSEEKTNTIW